ncbi:MAG: protein tyrosine/serine phosphatase [Caulobacteraceae bacterium]|nr:protein tyrosine/serine phosphatase [Caulobacteraceae bacterium]
MTRILPLEGVDNFRDFGDYPAGDRRIAKGRLYRSANHYRATDADLLALRALNLATIVDLRRRDERMRDPSRRWEGFACQVIDNDIGDDEVDSWHAFVKSCDLSSRSFEGYMETWYQSAAFEPRHLDLFSRALQALAQGEGPMLVHCAAGKDRTGILCGLIHHIAGAHRDDILADYLLTNQAAPIELRLERMIAYIEELNGKRPSPEAVRTAMGVQPRFLESTFEAIAARFGDVESYLEQALGVNATMRERVAESLAC